MEEGPTLLLGRSDPWPPKPAASRSPGRRGFQAAAVVPWIGLLLVALLIFWLIVNFIKTPGDFVSVALEGLTLGLVYGLIALGYSLVYGILELINFAHGDVFMLGSWISFAVAAQWFESRCPTARAPR